MQLRLVVWALLAGALLAGAAAWADSLFDHQAQQAGTLTAEPRAKFKTGDIITVLVREKTTASTRVDTRTRKESDVESEADPNDNMFWVGGEDSDTNGIFNPGELPNWKVEAENEHRSRGETRRTNEFVTTITCTVIEVMPNDNLMLQGEKRITTNREDSLFIVRGMVRAKDVTPQNTVLSTQMANATVELKGKGALWNSDRRGLLTRFLDWFSPF
ncbi:MAG TPA: flagellar basal body L-ring protein FlgH [Candidatus Hydrogenedentes bacterium]|nr:flagellar basal body L-ring protein FlgH [Candidatus Hydrogenedentota bacterium]HNT86324.1 flagellar basal body L-ring protein FlgH [Candidatus Hydrogenedentota bacterium]